MKGTPFRKKPLPPPLWVAREFGTQVEPPKLDDTGWPVDANLPQQDNRSFDPRFNMTMPIGIRSKP